MSLLPSLPSSIKLVLFNADLLGCIFEYFNEKSYLSLVMVNRVFASSYRRHYAYVHRNGLKVPDGCVSDVSWYCTSVIMLDWCLDMSCDASLLVGGVVRYGTVALLEATQCEPYRYGRMLMSVDTLVAACKHGNLMVLQWLRSRDPPCPWNSDACSHAE